MVAVVMLSIILSSITNVTAQGWPTACAVARMPHKVLHWDRMKRYIHARLSKQDRSVLEDLKKSTGQSESELVRRGIRLILAEVSPQRSALVLAGTSVGKFKKGPRDLSTNKKHMEGFGE
jgi:hypothetical protein